MKGLVIALFSIGLIFTVPDTAVAAKKVKPFCSVSKLSSGVRVSCKSKLKTSKKDLKIAAALKCIQTVGKVKLDKRMITKMSYAFCAGRTCKEIKALCKLKK